MSTAKPGLRELLRQPELIVAPGAYDGLTAKLIRNAGFPCVYMSGGTTSASYGYPDYGLLTMTEMVENAGRIANAVDIPVISDADNGYGNELNVFRTVQAFERAGIGGIHIEDQVSPKRCGHLEDKEIVPLDEFVVKIRAAVDARCSANFVIIARSDARARNGFEDAIARCNAALEAGADIGFLEAPQSLEEIAAVPKLVKGPCLLNIVARGKTPDIDLPAVSEMGYRVAILPGLVAVTVIDAVEKALAELRATHRHPRTELGPKEIFERAGSGYWEPLRSKYRR
jgi:2-methylisocitrate lyase-like PEP mutase family enzyme